MLRGFGGLGLALPAAGDMATARAMAASSQVSVPYNTGTTSGTTMLLVANPNGTTAAIPINSKSAPYLLNYSSLSSIGVIGLNDAIVGQALAAYGMAGGGPENIPSAPSAGSTIAQTANPPASQPPATNPAASSSCFALFGEQCVNVLGFNIGIYTGLAGLGLIGFVLLGGGHRR